VIYKKFLKGPKMLTAWTGKVGFAPAHSENQSFSPKYVLFVSSRKVCRGARDIFLKLSAADLNSATQHFFYRLARQQRSRLKRQEIFILL
jgi:hypothetical protein